MPDPIKKEYVNESLTEICKAVNILEQKVCALRDHLDLRGLPIPERGISYTKEIIGYFWNNSMSLKSIWCQRNTNRD